MNRLIQSQAPNDGCSMRGVRQAGSGAHTTLLLVGLDERVCEEGRKEGRREEVKVSSK